MARGGKFQQCYKAPPHNDGHGKHRTWAARKNDLHKKPERRDNLLMLNNANHAQRLAASSTILLHVQATQTTKGLPAAVQRPRRRTTCGGPRARGSSTRMITLQALALIRSTAGHPAATPDRANNTVTAHIAAGLLAHPASNAGSPACAPVGSADHDGSMVGSVVVITTNHDNKGEPPAKTDSPAGAHVLAADNNSAPAASLLPPPSPATFHNSTPHPHTLTSTLSARALLILHNLVSAGYPASPAATHATTPATAQLSQAASDHGPLISNDNNTVALANTDSSPADAPSSSTTPTAVPTTVADSSSPPATTPLTNTDVMTGGLPLWMGATPARCGLGTVIAPGTPLAAQRDLRPLHNRLDCKARSWPGHGCEITPTSPRQDASVPAPRKTWPASCTPTQCDEYLVGLHTPSWKIQAVRPGTTNACATPRGITTLPLPLDHSREIGKGMYLPCTPRSDFDLGVAEEEAVVRASKLKWWIRVLPSCMRPMQ